MWRDVLLATGPCGAVDGEQRCPRHRKFYYIVARCATLSAYTTRLANNGAILYGKILKQHRMEIKRLNQKEIGKSTKGNMNDANFSRNLSKQTWSTPRSDWQGAASDVCEVDQRVFVLSTYADVR